MKREKVLSDASTAIVGSKQKQHGDARQNFDITGNLWSVYIDGIERTRGVHGITAKDVAMMNILQKVSRSLFNEKHADHYMDIAGYAALAAEITEAK